MIDAVHKAGMECGISLNPETPVDVVIPFLMTSSSSRIDTVDILAVSPGFGGQVFRPEPTLTKLQRLRTVLEERDFFYGPSSSSSKKISLMVDGGIHEGTAAQAVEAGADVLVAGTYLFRHPDGLPGATQALLRTVVRPTGSFPFHHEKRHDDT